MNNRRLMEDRIHGEAGFLVSSFDGDFSEEETILAPLHYHPEYELVTATTGKIFVKIEKEEYVLREGECLLVPPSGLHMIWGEPGEKKGFFAVVFSNRFLAEEKERIDAKYFQGVRRGEIRLAVRLPDPCGEKLLKLKEVFAVKQFGYELCIKADVLWIMAKAFELSERSALAEKRFPHQEVKKALDYVAEHFNEEITLQDLAEETGMSREHFCRMFSEIASVSPIVYVNRFRVKKSLEYLRDSDKTIQQISDICGFGSASYYNRIFKKYMGQTPKEYRKYAILY